MTQAQVDAIHFASECIHTHLPKYVSDCNDRLQQHYSELIAKCDHKLPDGTDAHRDYSACSICGANIG